MNMQINKIPPFYNYFVAPQNRVTLPLVKNDCTTFTGANLSAKKLSFNHFKKNFEKRYHEHFRDVASSIMIEKNLLGEGHDKKVYKIPKMKDYVIAQLKKVYPNRDNSKIYPITPVNDIFPNINFGQAVATDNGGLLILKKVRGEEHSLKFWSDKYLAKLFTGKEIPETEAKIFLNKIDYLKKMPQDVYNKFAEKLQILNESNIRIDTINPNNLLISKKHPEINLVDVDFDKEVFECLTKPYNGISDMYSLLLDSLMFGMHYDKLSPKNRNKLLKNAQIIIKKCRNAGKKVGLVENIENSKNFLKELDGRIYKRRNKSPEFIPNYERFLELISGKQ